MSDNELVKITVEEFSRLQHYMSHVEKNSEAYQMMYERYAELKAILSALEVNLTELDHIH